MRQASIVIVVTQVCRRFRLVFKLLRGRVREHLTSFSVVNKSTDGLKAEILGYKFADFAEKTGEASLSAHFRCEL